MTRLALLLTLLLCCCTPAPPAETPVADPVPSGVKSSELEYVTTHTARGVEVELPKSLAEDAGLLIVALQEIDNNGVHVHLPGWRVRILTPAEKEREGLREKHRLIKVCWRYSDDPLDSLLPGLWDLIQGAR